MFNPVESRLNKKQVLIPLGVIRLTADVLSEVTWLVLIERLKLFLT